jgi:anti-sigma factor RsiW
MLTEALVALASTAGTTLVGAMATDAWQTARTGITRLFGRGSEARRADIEAQLDRNEAAVRQSERPDQIRQMLAPGWQVELQGLLEQSPEAEPELRELVGQIQQALPAAQRAWVQNIVQNVTASASGAFAAGAIGGNVNYYAATDSDEGTAR